MYVLLHAPSSPCLRVSVGRERCAYPRLANRRQLQPPTPTDLGRGSEGLVLQAASGRGLLEQLKGGATRLLQTGVMQNVADA